MIFLHSSLPNDLEEGSLRLLTLSEVDGTEWNLQTITTPIFPKQDTRGR